MNTKEKVRAIILERYPELTEENLPDAKEFSNGQLDSLEVIELGIEIERQFDIKIHDEEMEGWKCVNDIVKTIEKNEDSSNSSKV